MRRLGTRSDLGLSVRLSKPLVDEISAGSRRAMAEGKGSAASCRDEALGARGLEARGNWRAADRGYLRGRSLDDLATDAAPAEMI
jgi:hypothetical protein